MLKKHKWLLISLILFGIIFLSIGFSAFQNNLFIGNLSAFVQVDKDIRIMGIKLNTINNGINYNESYNVSNVNASLSLDDNDSYVIYDIDVYNLGNVAMGIRNITINYDNLNVELLDYNLEDKICENDQCTLGVKKKMQVKVSYKEDGFDASNTKYDIRIDFEFAQFYTIKYYNIESSNLPSEIIEGGTLNISLTKNSNEYLRVTMGNKVLSINNGFTYENNNLIISNIVGNIRISLNESTIMKEKIITAFVDSGNEEDIPNYDLENMTLEERTNTFNNPSTESSVYTTLGITGNNVIIFRGDIQNNYVEFGGYLWRILQIDENGNLRIILNDSIGRSHYSDETPMSDLESAKSILSFNNSLAKTKLDSWFKYLEPFQSKVVKSKFCNNFDYDSKHSSGSSNYTNYFQSYLNVGPDSGLYSPSLQCPSNYIFDDFIGLISGEEYVLAGGAFEKSNTNFFLYNSNIYSSDSTFKDHFWTLSPAYNDTSRKDGGVMIVSKNGTLTDWSGNLLKSNFLLRPVITINGDDEMQGDGTKDNPYSYPNLNTTASRYDVSDLSELNNNTFFIGHILGKKQVDGLLSSSISNTLTTTGLLGKGTATFSDDKSKIINKTATMFTFVDGTMVSDDASDGYYYYIKTLANQYLKINDDNTIELTEEPTQLKVKLGTMSTRTGHIVISNKNETMYLNFYGAESGQGDDKFAGWNTIDENSQMLLYKPN